MQHCGPINKSIKPIKTGNMALSRINTTLFTMQFRKKCFNPKRERGRETQRDAERVGDEDNVRRTRRMWIRVQWLTWVPVAGMGRARAASGSMLGCTTLCGISWFSWCSWQPCTLRAWRCHTLCKVAVIMGIIAASFGMCMGIWLYTLQGILTECMQAFALEKNVKN